MDTGPALFTGGVFALFGAGLLLWTGARLRRGGPVVSGAGTYPAAVVAGLAGTGSLALGVWCLTLA